MRNSILSLSTLLKALFVAQIVQRATTTVA